MTPLVGQVIRAYTEDVIDPADENGSHKYHLCINAAEGHHLFVCRQGFPYDFPLPQHRCAGLPEPVSYISLSRVILRRHFPKKHRIACTVTDTFLRELLGHVEDARTLAPRDKWMISTDIAKHLNDNNAR